MNHDQHISIAMCTYNGSCFLRDQLDSIAKQIRLPDELVICDDGSSDSTPDIVNEFSRLAPFPVRFIRNSQNLGSTKNFEQAIALCEGDLIALCDQDDIWLPEKLARQAEVMDRDPSLGGVFSDAELVDEQSLMIGRRLWESILFSGGEQKLFMAGHETKILIKKNVITGATLMFRKSMRYALLPIPSSWVHDGWIAWMLTLHSRLIFMQDPLIQYRLHANQQVGIEAITLGQSMNLRQRLQKGKREEPAQHLLGAVGLEELERHLIAVDDANCLAILPALRKKIRFFKDRGNQCGNRCAKLIRILQNIGNYHRYERGWKIFFRDILIVFA